MSRGVMPAKNAMARLRSTSGASLPSRRSELGVPDGLLAAAGWLRDSLRPLRFGPPVSHVYNPLEYAWEAHSGYVRRFANGRRRVLFLGMNPGPFGMTQTGVPFGEVEAVRSWMGLDFPVGKPAQEHPKRPVEGMSCRRSEVSGRRLWGWAASRFGAPDDFFRECFVVNYCPLLFMEDSGRNRTPDKVPAVEMEPVTAACDAHLSRVLELLQPEWALGVGGFAEKRLAAVVARAGAKVRVGTILHPSPASPAANRGWAEAVDRQLAVLGVFGEGDPGPAGADPS
jgi:single-strand selective monofunctional uracil DNA glycosylase